MERNTKQVWETQEITEQIAHSITLGLFDNSLTNLVELIKDAFNTVDIKYDISLKEGALYLTMSIVVYRQQTKDVVVIFNNKEVSEIFKLQQIIKDQQQEISSLQNEVTSLCQEITAIQVDNDIKQKELNSHHEIITALQADLTERQFRPVLRVLVAGPLLFRVNQQLELARIPNLPTGRWVVKFMFQLVTTEYLEATFLLKLGDEVIVDEYWRKCCTRFPNVSCVVESAGGLALCLNLILRPNRTIQHVRNERTVEPSIKDIILQAKKLQ